MKPYLIEFIGAFFLVLTIALTGNPIAIGFVLATVVYMGGYISGGHYNPAVTLTILLNRKIKLPTALLYMVAQVLGAFAAAAVAAFSNGKTFIPAPAAGATIAQVLVLEILFTFLLCSVVLNTAVAEKTKGNSYYGLAIGLVVLVGAFAAGPISGGVFNPAVALGPMLWNFQTFSANLTNLGLYIVGPFLGSAIAALMYKIK